MLLSRIHWILGCICAIFWFCSAFTGAVLVSNPRYGPIAATHSRVSPGDALDAASDAAEGTPTMLTFPYAGNRNYVVTLRRKHGIARVEVSPQTGGANMQQGRDLLAWITEIHHDLGLGFLGKAILTLSGICLFIVAATGLTMWSTRLIRHRRCDAHTVLGIVAAIPLLITSACGTTLELHGIFARSHAVAQVYGHAHTGAASPDIDINRAVTIADAAVPREHVSQIVFPMREHALLLVQMLPGEIRDPRLQTEVRLDPQTLALRSIVTPSSRPLAERLYAFVYALHIGIIGGFITRAFAFLTALLLITLTGTGLAKVRFDKSSMKKRLFRLS
jgi:uncharacterized iron-regulated membrane protein